MVATSATRDAANRDEFFAMTAEVLGVVRAGRGGRGDHRDRGGRAVLPRRGRRIGSAAAPFVVVDLGGGSTEVVLGDARRSTASFSAEHRLRAAHRTLPAVRSADGRGDRRRARTWCATGWPRRSARCPSTGARTWVGVAGTMTTLAALAQRMPTYDSEAIHLSRVGFDDLLRGVRRT